MRKGRVRPSLRAFLHEQGSPDGVVVAETARGSKARRSGRFAASMARMLRMLRRYRCFLQRTRDGADAARRCDSASRDSSLRWDDGNGGEVRRESMTHRIMDEACRTADMRRAQLGGAWSGPVVTPDSVRGPPRRVRDRIAFAGRWMPDQVRHDGAVTGPSQPWPVPALPPARSERPTVRRRPRPAGREQRRRMRPVRPRRARR